MPNIKQDLFNRCAEMLDLECRRAQKELYTNRKEIKRLAEKQKVLKVLSAESSRLMWAFKNNKPVQQKEQKPKDLNGWKPVT